jgi:hypothetical protein
MRAHLGIASRQTATTSGYAYLLLDVLLLLVIHGLETLGDLLEKSLGLEVGHGG